MGKTKSRKAILPIASPLAGHRLTKKIVQLIKSSCESKNLVYGVKDTKKNIVKGESGLVIFGGNVTPMDVITHLPGYCEEYHRPYIFLKTKEELSAAAQRDSPVACLVVKEPTDEETRELYDEIIASIKELNEEEQEN